MRSLCELYGFLLRVLSGSFDRFSVLYRWNQCFLWVVIALFGCFRAAGKRGTHSPYPRLLYFEVGVFFCCARFPFFFRRVGRSCLSAFARCCCCCGCAGAMFVSKENAPPTHSNQKQCARPLAAKKQPKHPAAADRKHSAPAAKNHPQQKNKQSYQSSVLSQCKCFVMLATPGSSCIAASPDHCHPDNVRLRVSVGSLIGAWSGATTDICRIPTLFIEPFSECQGRYFLFLKP